MKFNPTVSLTEKLIPNLLLQPKVKSLLQPLSLPVALLCIFIPYWSFPHPNMHAYNRKKCLRAENVAQKGQEPWKLLPVVF